ncbi:hypothetical protein ACFXB3_07075 [Streptomyces sp. NPDC059447]|uniref:hypothetical protein n=1 Tax=Streptomyces sp. NPDC059447 TaxID=3346834 RepID=UPI00369B4B0F
MNDIPAVYCGTDVPPHIHLAWHRWEGAKWRTFQHLGQNKLYPPDMRFTVRPPDGMCWTHRKHWRDYRDMLFDYETGNRWPGYHGSPFEYVGTDMNRLREERRVQWDRKASEQMQLIERICPSRRSPQCTPAEEIPTPRSVVDVHLPEVAA